MAIPAAAAIPHMVAALSPRQTPCSRGPPTALQAILATAPCMFSPPHVLRPLRFITGSARLAAPLRYPSHQAAATPTSQLWSPRLHPCVPHSHPGDVPPTLTPPGPTPYSAFTTRCHPTHIGIQNPNPPSPCPCNQTCIEAPLCYCVGSTSSMTSWNKT